MIQKVYISLQTTVLLFCLDKCSDDFLYVQKAAPRLLPYLLKSILYNAGIAHVLIKEVLLLFIRRDNFLQAQFQDSDWVGELLFDPARSGGCTLSPLRSSRSGAARGLIKGLVIELDGLVALLEALLQLLYF